MSLVENRICKEREFNQFCIFCQTAERSIDIDVILNNDCEKFQCPDGFVKCPLSYCIPIRYIEDGTPDCLNGEDEIRDIFQTTGFLREWADLEDFCHHALIPGFASLIAQRRDKDFIYRWLRYNYLFCAHGENNLNVPRKMNFNYQCRRNNVDGFRKKGILLHPDSICDGEIDCPYGDDELDCFNLCSPGLLCTGNTVTVHNSSQVLLNTSGDDITPRTKLLDLSGIQLKNLRQLMDSRNLAFVTDLRLKNCNLTNVELFDKSAWYLRENPAFLYRYSILSTKLFYLDLSKNNIVHFEKTSIWVFDAQKLNLSENPKLNLKFDSTKNGLALYAQYMGMEIKKRDTHNQRIRFLQIKILDLSYTNINNRDLMELERFTNLEEIYLRSCPISNLRLEFPYLLRIIDLREMIIKIPQDDYFSNLTSLVVLMVDNYELCCPKILGGTIKSSVCTNAIQESISSCTDLIGNTTLRTVLWVMCLLALVGNSVVIIYRCAFDRNTFKSSHGIFIFNLSTADMLMGIYLMTLAVKGEIIKGEYYKHHQDWKKGEMCKVIGFISTLSSEVSTFFILLITTDRFLAVRFPFRQLKISVVRSAFLCGCAWLLGILLSVIPLLMPDWEIYSVDSICVGLPLTSDNYNGKTYSVSIFVFLNFLLFILIAIGQYSILKAKATINQESQMFNEAVARRRYETDLAIARQLSLVVITDFLCWFPIGLMGMMSLAGQSVSTDAYLLAAILIVPINSAINPLLYTVPVLKQKWAELTSKCFRSEISVSLDPTDSRKHI